ncbi:hypothetical protein [Nonomuraea sp. GTA35]|uniref:hypothetical protein n=1 Tax=Nonomuraea sp. GTA35 TaxID=1676746 RepID=UPI0035C1A6A3
MIVEWRSMCGRGPESGLLGQAAEQLIGRPVRHGLPQRHVEQVHEHHVPGVLDDLSPLKLIVRMELDRDLVHRDRPGLPGLGERPLALTRRRT